MGRGRIVILVGLVLVIVGLLGFMYYWFIPVLEATRTGVLEPGHAYSIDRPIVHSGIVYVVEIHSDQPIQINLYGPNEARSWYTGAYKAVLMINHSGVYTFEITNNSTSQVEYYITEKLYWRTLANPFTPLPIAGATIIAYQAIYNAVRKHYSKTR
jgi:hypothetical protein